MREIHTNLFVGGDDACASCATKPEFAILHACKSCHQEALAYRSALPPSHPSYLIHENPSHLYLNMVDMPNELLPEYTHPMVKRAMEFIEQNLKTKKVLIHCNFGMSRSPSLGLIYLARTGIIPKSSLEKAAGVFAKLYPRYSPGEGISLYMKRNWDYLMGDLSQ